MNTPLTLFHDQERARLQQRANYTGWVLLLFLLLQFPLAFFEMLLAQLLSDGKEISLSAWLAPYGPAAVILYGIAQYLILLGVPLLVGLYFCRKIGAKPIAKQKVPATNAIPLLMAGLGACVFANFVANLVAEWASTFGLEQPAMPSSQNGTLPILLLSLLSTAVLPAIMEELLFRGVILQLLRPAGDLTALILSSVLFGVTHGTITQIPFAIVIGLVCGYFVLKTGNIYLGMVLHFLNNAIVVVLECLLLPDPNMNVACNYVVFIGMAVLGLVGWLYLRQRAPHALAPVYDGRPSWVSRAERRCTVWFAPTILIFIFLMLLLTVLTNQLAEWLSDLKNLLSMIGGLPLG